MAVLATLSGAGRGQDAGRKGPLPAESDKALQEAVAALDEVRGDALIRARLWCEMAAFSRTHGDRDGAVADLGRARTVAESDRRELPEAARAVGEGLARLGDAKAVLDLVSVVPPAAENRRGNPQETVLQEAARAAAEAGHIKAAEQIADALPEGRLRTSLRDGIGRQALIHQARTGDAAGAIRAATKLPTAADTVFAFVGRPIYGLAFDDDVRTVDGIAPAQLADGDKEGAVKTVRSALALLQEVDAARRGQAVVGVVRMLARLDDVAGARLALARLPAADPKADERAAAVARTGELIAKGYLAAAEVRAGRDDAALALANDFTRPGEQAYVLHFAGLAQARVGRKEASAKSFARAVELVTKRPDADRAGTSLHNIVSAQAAAGDFAGAARTAALNPGGTLAWANLATLQARAGEFDAARKVATDHIADSRYWSAQVLEFVAERQARAGKAAAVREWIGAVDDRLVRAHALFGLAKGLAPEAGKEAKR